MALPLRVLLLCAALLLSCSHASILASSAAGDVTATRPFAHREVMMQIDPSQDSQRFEIPYEPNYYVPSPATGPVPLPPARRADSMEGAMDRPNGVKRPSEAQSVAEDDTAAAHSMHTLQTTAEFTMAPRTTMAPWSPRIQPGLMYRTREINYLQVGTGLRVRLGAGYLMMYEGAMTNRTGTTVSMYVTTHITTLAARPQHTHSTCM